MKTAAAIGMAVVVCVVATTTALASDPAALYARVDRVVLDPNADAPQTVQIWGVFALARPDDRNDYLPPARGYLYFTLPADARAARAEWADLSQVAGSGQIVSFGSRYDRAARLRRADERPANPDPYSVN